MNIYKLLNLQISETESRFDKEIKNLKSITGNPMTTKRI